MARAPLAAARRLALLPLGVVVRELVIVGRRSPGKKQCLESHNASLLLLLVGLGHSATQAKCLLLPSAAAAVAVAAPGRAAASATGRGSGHAEHRRPWLLPLLPLHGWPVSSMYVMQWMSRGVRLCACAHDAIPCWLVGCVGCVGYDNAPKMASAHHFHDKPTGPQRHDPLSAVPLMDACPSTAGAWVWMEGGKCSG